MKNLLAFVAVNFLAMSGKAQNFDAPRAVCYRVMGQVFYQSDNCVPGSEVAFYTKVTGGRQLAAPVADAAGRARLLYSADTSQQPAFALNRQTYSGSPIPGNGKVDYYGEQEFNLQTVALSRNGGSTDLSWEAAAPAAPLVFDVLKSADGSNYTLATSLTATNGPSLQTYTWTDASGSDSASYKISVRHTTYGEHYTTPAISGPGTGISTYRTANPGIITVAASPEWQGIYKVYSMSGQQVLSGRLIEARNSLDMSSLAAGTYLLKVSNRKEIRTVKITRE